MNTPSTSSGQIHWRVQLHPDVIRYLISLRERGSAIRAVIGQLSSNGIPNEAKQIKQKPNHWLRVDARHWITCRLVEDEHAIYVTKVEFVGGELQ